MDDPTSNFMRMVSCMCMFSSNFDAALNVEHVLKTDGKLMMLFNSHRSGKFNRDTFLQKGVSEPLIFSLFYPRANSLFVEHMIGMHRDDEPLIIFLVEQYQAQQVWDTYFTYAEEFHIITAKTVRSLADRIRDLQLENCTLRNQFFSLENHIPKQSPKITTKIASAFEDVLPKNIRIDLVQGDGNCFFASLENQLRDLVDNLSAHAFRAEIERYCRANFDEFAHSAVKVWRSMFASDPYSAEWAFFSDYAVMESDWDVARAMLRNKMFLQPNFYAEAFTMSVTVEYINRLLSRKLMIILIDTVNEPSPVLGHTELGKQNMYIFLLKEPLRYSSMSINNRRVFTRRTLPKLGFKFLEDVHDS
jgi:hypothetical protein